MADPQVTESKSEQALRELFASGHPLLYVLSADEQRISALLRRGAQQHLVKPVPYWSWSITEGLREGDGTPQRDHRSARRARLHRRARRHRRCSTSRTSTSRCATRSTCAGGCAISSLLCTQRGQCVVISAPVREIPEELASSILFVELSVPDFTEMRAFLAQQVAAFGAAGQWVDTRDTTLDLIARALLGLTLDEAGFALRRAVARRRTPRPRIAADAARGEAAARQSHGHDRVHRRRPRPRSHRRPRGDEELAASSAARCSIRRPDRRGAGAQGRAGDGRVGLRQEPVDQGDRVDVRAAALPHRHGRGVLGPQRHAGMGVRACVPDDGGDRARRRVVRRDRDGHHRGRGAPASRAASSRSS